MLEAVAIFDAPGSVTGADLHPDGRRLAVCGYAFAAVIDLDPAAPWERLEDPPRSVVRFTGTSVEGCAWDGEMLLLVAENRDVYRVPMP